MSLMSTVSRKQKRLGPAPIASMEDTSAEDKNQMDANGRLQHSHECDKSIDSCSTSSPTRMSQCTVALAPLTPRIDISRASSHSSHHDSRDSSPENVFDQVGTGTLQDSGVLGFREEDTLDLRNSTEELQFMEHDKGKTEKEKPRPLCSPIITRFEPDPQTHLLNQHNRKDSVNSEVVAFLSISGRTSRLSSVGSQGSATSKLSAASGISRSPSPHKMLLETSFCGPKPLQTYNGAGVSSGLEPYAEKMLEQAILSRKKDPSEVVLAEGVEVRADDVIATAPRIRRKTEGSNASQKSASKQQQQQDINQIQSSDPKSPGGPAAGPTDDDSKSIIGVMPSGTEYIRIKLKPDYCYSDNGLAQNERIIEAERSRRAAAADGSSTHVTLHAKSSLDASRSPASRFDRGHADYNSRSPSPATVGPISRKTSFCSLFKLGDSALSENANHFNCKKNRTWHESAGAGDRKKQPGGDPLSVNSTPSKQKSVLGLFKSKRPSDSSKSPRSPVPVTVDMTPDGGAVSPYYGDGGGKRHSEGGGSARMQLRYYDTPLEGDSIHIPLRTPPEEKRAATALGFLQPLVTPTPSTQKSIADYRSTHSARSNSNVSVTLHDRPKPMAPLKCYRIENPDGSVTIPLKSPIDSVQPGGWDEDMGVVLPPPPEPAPAVEQAPEPEVFRFDTGAPKPVTAIATATTTAADTTVNAEAEARRLRILFRTKVGSGSEEQMFTTRLSYTRGESLGSQLSELSAVAPTSPPPAEHNEANAEDMAPGQQPEPEQEQDERTNKSPLTPGSNHQHQHHQQQQQQRLAHPMKKLSKSSTNSASQDDLGAGGGSGAGGGGASSESERDSEVDSTTTGTTSRHTVCPSMIPIEDHESAGLVFQESFDDELPYIPTTLPEERPVGIKLVPVKERGQIEMKTYPLERPRSTTPIYTSTFEHYCADHQAAVVSAGRGETDTRASFSATEKLRICLPRKASDPNAGLLMKGPGTHKVATIGSSNPPVRSTVRQQLELNGSEGRTTAKEEPPPLPPRKHQPGPAVVAVAAAAATQPQSQPKWIDFEAIPEMRKAPKRITAISKKRLVADQSSDSSDVLLNYVNPEDCQCECHEHEREVSKVGVHEATPECGGQQQQQQPPPTPPPSSTLCRP